MAAVKTRTGKMVIITSYFEGESYGLLGPQLAATIIEEHTPYECLVVAVTRSDSMDEVKKAIWSYLGAARPVIGFSTLGGRPELFELARELKEEGAITILGGPQADVDYIGEVGWEQRPNRFQGLHSCFSLAVHGPAEQAIPILESLEDGSLRESAGLIAGSGDRLVLNPSRRWEAAFFNHVRWTNLCKVENGNLQPLEITTAQVIQQIGCPYAARKRNIKVDYPTVLGGEKAVELSLQGCSFCDVATDKGYIGSLPFEVVLEQIRNLPERNGVKIPFELINENPLPGLPSLLEAVKSHGIKLSQVHLVMRADWFCRHADLAKTALHIAEGMGVQIRLASMGFEAFDDTLLRNLNKGTTVELNLRAIRLMRELKREFPRNWAYSRQEGSIHGLIHPTPWDTDETWNNTERTFAIHSLHFDILPAHSIPLIIHHACPLGEWARKLEETEAIEIPRRETIIEWWHLPDGRASS